MPVRAQKPLSETFKYLFLYQCILQAASPSAFTLALDHFAKGQQHKNGTTSYKVMFLYLSVSHFVDGEVYPSIQWEGSVHPLGRHHLGSHPPERHPLGRHPHPWDGHWSGQYASYWNEFLFLSEITAFLENHRKTGVNGMWIWIFEWAIITRF